MSVQRLWIDGPLPSLNELLGAKRLRRGRSDRYGKLKHAWHERVMLACLAARLAPAVQPVLLHFEWRELDQRRDPDNIVGAGQKLVLDALVRARILRGDGQRWIRGLAHAWRVDAARPGVEVTIAEVEA